MTYIGEIAALLAALFWAMASVIYRRLGVTLPPLTLNGIKGTVSILLVMLTMVFTATSLPVYDHRQWGILFISGVIGIGLGDTAFFVALNALGERRTVLTVETLAPPLTVVLAAVFLREYLNLGAMAGILITLAGVFWVLAERTPKTDERRYCMKGISWGAIAALCQAVGNVMSRGVIGDSSLSPLWSSLVRLMGGLLFVIAALALKRERAKLADLFSKPTLAPLFTAIFFGTYLAIVLQQLSLKFTSAGITQTLIATSAIFVIPFVIIRGEKTSVRAILGSLVAVAGVALLFFTT